MERNIKTAGSVLLKQQDRDPFCGSAEAARGDTVLDGTYNSVVYDMGCKARINRVELFSDNRYSRITKNFTALYISDDNEHYTAVRSFTLLKKPYTVAFFNFSVEARYIKVHFTYHAWGNRDYMLRHELETAMTAYFSDSPLYHGGADFAHKASFYVENNTDEAVYDKLLCYSLRELGIDRSALRADLADLRFRTDRFELPHYCRGERIYVRLPELPANTKERVTVLWGNGAAEQISSGEATLEVEYGTKAISRRPEGVHWRNSVERMPDGSLLQMGCFAGDVTCLGYERSRDGGHTWSHSVQVPNTYGLDGGGFLVDHARGIVFYLGYHHKAGDLYILRSDDSGNTWSHVQVLQGCHLFTYSAGIRLSCYDGDGPAVDYVFTVAASTGVSDHTDFPYYNTAIYSRDGGKAWQISESRLRFGGVPQEEYWVQFESGMTEEAVWEQKDGTLVMYSRYQGRINGEGNPPHFLMSYSHDHGVTWGDTKLSTVFSTNTQPILYPLNGVPTLFWGGNNSGWFRSYQRFPISIAYSLDDAENFVGIQDLSHQTAIMSRREFRRHNEEYIVTNPNITYFERGGCDHAFAVITNYRILIENFSDYLYKTKGAFDAFDLGSTEAEGWFTVSGTTIHPGQEIVPGEAPQIVESSRGENAFAMRLTSQTEISRTLPYATRGEVFFTYAAEAQGEGTDFELQSAYNRKQQHISSPLRVRIGSEGEVCYFNDQGTRVRTGLRVREGANEIMIKFDAKAGEASIEVNGEAAEIAFVGRMGAYVCFAHFRNGKDCVAEIEAFGMADLR